LDLSQIGEKITLSGVILAGEIKNILIEGKFFCNDCQKELVISGTLYNPPKFPNRCLEKECKSYGVKVTPVSLHPCVELIIRGKFNDTYQKIRVIGLISDIKENFSNISDLFNAGRDVIIEGELIFFNGFILMAKNIQNSEKEEIFEEENKEKIYRIVSYLKKNKQKTFDRLRLLKLINKAGELTQSEIAKMFKISPRTLRNWIKEEFNVIIDEKRETYSLGDFINTRWGNVKGMTLNGMGRHLIPFL